MYTEKSPLTGGQPTYQNPSRMYKKQVKQFQCLLCAAVLSLFAIALITAIVFSVDEDELDNLINGNASLEGKLQASPGGGISEVEFNKALKQGLEKVMEEEDAMMRSPKILVNTPSYRHFRLVSFPENYNNVSRLGQLSDELTKYFIREKPELRLNISSVNVAENEEFKEYCRSSRSRICRSSQYRSIDGACNNLQHPDWGTSMRPFLRLLSPEYCDGVSEPRCGSREALPPARDVTLKLHRANYKSDHKFNFMFAVWGQFIDHDITATAITRLINGQMVSCCGSKGIDKCYPVILSEDDPIFILYNTSCMEFVRSTPAPRCTLGPREQLNQQTSFLDGSVIYGSNEELSRRLRSFQGGRMAVSVSEDGRDLLPVSIDLTDGCNREEEAKNGRYCFLAGDVRANENLHLTTLHVIMVRHHNRIASRLQQLNPQWDDERTYQETRKIVTAQVQHITYKELLVPLLGEKIMESYDLKVRTSAYSTIYDDTINPSIANNFATSSFRFAHSLLPGLMKSYEETSPDSLTLLRKIFFNPFPLYTAGSLDRILMSAVGTDVQKANRFFTTEVTQHLFEEPQNMTVPKKCGLDLVSMNIQRGRDHGLPGYPKWRVYCNLTPVKEFNDLKKFMDDESVEALQRLYKTVDDIDLYSGSLSETPLKGSMLGPTATCLIAEQFRRTKFGDRFWYDAYTGPHSFTADQLKEIKKTTLARIVCDNSDNVKEVPENLLLFSGISNKNIQCEELADIDFAPWSER
uniref:Haem peroxidase n=1 Tax=Lygus hesperus TaxID=30085 RepID=A0A3S9Y2N1_LYGHE|nr:haem peroxidase [Lygus hesperus]